MSNFGMSLFPIIRNVLLAGLLVLPLRAQNNVAEQYLLSAANQERAARGIAPLSVDAALTAAALAHAEKMADHRTISHQFAGEAELSERGSAAGARFSLISENVAEAPTALMVHDAWMNSTGHRENLLDPRVDAIGIAVVVRERQMYAVQDFARSTRMLTLAQQESTVAMLLERSGVSLVPETEDARAICATDAGSRAASRPSFVMRYTAGSLDVLPREVMPKIEAKGLRHAAVGACADHGRGPFSAYRIAILFYP